ncbi:MULTISPECIES: Calx-beta domain-containing protein [unclassified Mesorhizobium]|uniref:Calx-beta domain-containing protein n=1 Tax=unclassified Mesorhizobium TaxID=325217 RepID=UPI0033398AF2
MAIGDIKTFNITSGGLTLQVTAIDMGNGTTTFDIKCVSGYADINAIYWGDDVADGSQFDLGTKKDNSLNMNGTGVDFDGGLKLSSTGLGTEGVNKATYLTAGEHYSILGANVNWADVDVFGIRATSTSTAEGSIKGTDGSADVTLAPKVCVDDATPVVEGNNASFLIHLDHVYAYDVTVNYTTVGGTATDGTDYTHTQGSVVIHAGDLNATVLVATTDDAAVESTEGFTLHLTGATADIPGPDISVALLCIDGDGTILDNDVAPPPPPPVSDLGLSHGYWMTHDGTGPQPNDWNVATDTSFESIFGDHGSWDIDAPFDTNGAPYTQGAVVADIDFTLALSLGGGGQNALAREAVGAYLNAIDEDNVDNGGTGYDFAYSAQEVKDLVNDAFDTGNDGSGGHTMQQVIDLLLASHD